MSTKTENVEATTPQIEQRKKPIPLRFIAGAGGVALVTLAFAPHHDGISQTTVALVFLLIILLTATFAGRSAALFAALAGALSFNFFFLPPIGALTISHPQNWIAWAAFVITALVAGQLSALARRRAEEALRQKQEIEKLYDKLQRAFEKASRAEALRQSDRLKSALLDAVTHDLRTPLTSIKAAVTTLLDDEKQTDAEFRLDADGKREFLEIINEETDRLNRQIEAMVELAKIEAGALKQRAGKTRSSVEKIVQTALLRAERLLAEHRVAVEIEPRLPEIAVDAEAVSEVVYTLLDNAAKYSPPNTTIIVTVRYAPVESVKFSVADEGRGVPLEMRERVFDRFFRAELDEKEKGAVGGLGMGLAIARGIVESHGGRIWITNGANGRGSRFIFTIPVGGEI
jgi:K+-sensing histidine kinase KdpD